MLLADRQISASTRERDTEFLWFTANIIEDVYRTGPAKAARFIAMRCRLFDTHPRRDEVFLTSQSQWEWYKIAADKGPIEASYDLGRWAHQTSDHRNGSDDVDHLPEAMPYLHACAAGVSNSWEPPDVFGRPALYAKKFTAFFQRMDGTRKGAARMLSKIYDKGKGGVPADPALAGKFARMADEL